jgi:long-chain acyl-CoA synthetase
MADRNDAESIRWRKYYSNSEFHLEYPEGTLWEMVEKAGEKHEDRVALDFLGKKITFAEFLRKIEEVSKAFCAIGIETGDRVTLALPNIPQALSCFYGLNKIGAVPSMIHPLSAEAEIQYYLEISKSKAIVTLDSFTKKLRRR